MKSHAAVNETVSLVVHNNRGFANAILRRVASRVDPPRCESTPFAPLRQPNGLLGYNLHWW